MPVRKPANTKAAKAEREATDLAKLGEMVLDQLNALAAKHVKGGLTKPGQNITVALPFSLELKKSAQKNCKCEFVCTILDDGSKECILICRGPDCV